MFLIFPRTEKTVILKAVILKVWSLVLQLLSPTDSRRGGTVPKRPRDSEWDMEFIRGTYIQGWSSGGSLERRTATICKKHAVYVAFSLSTYDG